MFIFGLWYPTLLNDRRKLLPDINRANSPIIYGSGRLPPNQHSIEITIPSGVTYRNLNPSHLPGWDDPTCTTSKHFGEDWQRSKLSLLLRVPSRVARCERNILINPEHPDLHKIAHSLAIPVWWDARLFGD